MTYDSPPVPCIVLTFQQHFRVVWFGESMVMTCIKVCSLAICCPRTEILICRPESDLWYCCGYFFAFTVGVVDPKNYPLNPEDMCFSVWGLPSHSHMFQLFEDAENLFFFDTVTNSATESITMVPRPGKFEMRLACRAHLLRWALTQGCGTKGQEILAALTHGLTVYVKFLTHVWKGQYLNTMYCIISQFRNRVIH